MGQVTKMGKERAAKQVVYETRRTKKRKRGRLNKVKEQSYIYGSRSKKYKMGKDKGEDESQKRVEKVVEKGSNHLKSIECTLRLKA